MKTIRNMIISGLLLIAVVPFAARAVDKPTPSQVAGPGTTGQVVKAQPATAVPSLPRPSVIYVTDFHLDPSQIEQSKKLLGGQREGSPGGRLGQRRNKGPEEEAPTLVRVLSDSIIKHLKSEGLRAEFLPNVSANYMPDQASGRIRFLPGSSSLPKEGWLVTGWFEKVEKGNAAVEATVGFGKGSGSATADVVVSDLARDPAQPLLVMGSGSRAKKMPGGLVTMNPYVMAAKFVMNKRQGTEKEVKSLGTEIAKSLVQYINRGPAEPQRNVPTP